MRALRGRPTFRAVIPSRVRLALCLIAVPLLVAGLGAVYVKYELAEPEPFADRAVAALQSRAVREAIAEQIAVELVERGSPDLVASRPLVLTGVEAVLETDQFERVLRRTAIGAHALVLRGDRDVVVELEQATDILLPAVRSVSPAVAGEIPPDLALPVAEIRRSDPSAAAVRAARTIDALAIPLLLRPIGLLLVSVGGALDRRRAAVGVGVAAAAAGALGIVCLTGLRAEVVSHGRSVGALSDSEARAAAGAAWDAFAGGLGLWFGALATAGLALAGGGLLARARVDRGAALRRGSELVAGGRLSAPARLVRGVALAALGGMVLLRAEPVSRLATIALGGGLVVLGLAEALSLLRTADGGSRRRPTRLLVAAAATLLGGAALATALILRDDRPAPPAASEITVCNGSRALCDRRLDQVTFAGTHNSMSAADRPGWYFANQVRPIPRQLDDGIRLLMLDPHYGVVDSHGRVRTDLPAEGTNRNRASRRLGLEATRVAERLAGRLGLVPTDGDREVFLCHSLCELGAERMSATLGEIRGFLERNPAEVLMVFLESSVDPADVERVFEEADLGPYLATLDRDAPLPTLRDMISSGRRVVVLDERDGGQPGWYQPGFLFVRETRIGPLIRNPLSCEPNRGTPEAPLVLMNHWIDGFPPSVRANARISDRTTLEARVRRCRRQLGAPPRLIAVDFYERGDLLSVVRRLNRTG